ncbi:uncharacterized protein LOC111865368 isoform X2 [Cryptotermes secundus]|uniref:uncharacterized protein LOC111865368 isoform X2 n=1 Tax=Cryptotermes secundus TaxID=105785 RepID=UPI000CD7CA1F|nr:uncharacterized protein LOC111865368 isoform X2 [Cryptotermes secundus]
MEETPKSKRRSRLTKGRVVKNKSSLKECTPTKAVPPKDHSTPLDCKKVSSTSATISDEHKDVTEDEDDECSPFHFYCTQDTLAVGWDCGSPQQRPSKRLESKVKRKLTKGNSFTQKKQSLKSCSPIEPLRPRRRFNIEKPTGDLSELIPQLQFVADLVKKIKDQDDGTTQCDESCATDGRKEDGTVSTVMKAEGCSSFCSKEENLAVNAPKNGKELISNDKQKVERAHIVSPHQDLDLLKEKQQNIGCETFSALLDDDADQYMLRCSQEVEENLSKNITVVCGDNSELLLPDYKNSELFSVESKVRSPDICRPDKNSPFHVKLNSSGSKKANSPKVGTKYYVRIKSGTPKYSKNEHGHSRSSVNHSGATVRICHTRTNTESAVINSVPSNTNEFAFDDSFDAVIQNLSEEDIEMLSQGQIVDKKNARKITGTNICKPTSQKVEDKTEINCKRGSIQRFASGQLSPTYRLTGNNRPLNQVNSNRQMNSVNQGPALREVSAPRVNKMQFLLKVPSAMCSNRRLSDCSRPDSPVQFSEPHFNKDIPLVKNKLFVTQQRPSDSAHVKNSDGVQPNSSAISNSLALNVVPKSSPQKYTPEEIQKKRLEAIKKLEMKKMTMLCEKDKHCHLSKGP